ncbi:putative trehalose synthase [Mycobacterium kansasii]|uniref:Putative trehalose synthase n=1 Tax=Mycobacterium kansasii TaxID=1768 RepID=A0A1V3W9G6_MYCKA|nr:putative trehalose synthase [Mycobacterium kansasii]
MKANVGIRRRLAPLLDNDRNQIQLFNALLLSLPARRCCITATKSAWVT